MEPFEVVDFKPKLNKKKVFLVILILIIIAASAFGGIKLAEYIKIKKAEQEIELAKQVEQERIEQEEREKEELKRQEEAKRLRNATPLTEEQMNAIENIYDNVGEKRVFLTFDDGPTQSVTPFILDLLKQENIKATFFVLGNRVKANPDLIQREFDEGHYIANHGYTHKYSAIYQSNQNVLDEYNYTETAIQEALNNPDYHSRIFRFPGGSNGGIYHSKKQQAKQFLKENNIAYLDWNCLSKDAEGANTKEKLLQNVIDTMGTKQSVVILMHDASDKILTYETLPDVIKYLRDNGYEFKTLYDVL